VQSSRARKNEANYQEPAGSDDGGDKSESEDDISSRSESPNPLQPTSTEGQLESNIDEQAVAGHRSTEQGADLETTAPPKLYLFSGGGFCLPDEDDEILASLDEGSQAELHGGPNEVSNGHLGSSQQTGVDPDISGLPTEGQEFTQTETQSTDVGDVPVKTDANVGSGLRAIPFLRKKRPPKQP
jgi:DNA excision repair protein ERCC-5